MNVVNKHRIPNIVNLKDSNGIAIANDRNVTLPPIDCTYLINSFLFTLIS